MDKSNVHVDVVDWKLVGKCNLRCRHCYGPPKCEPALPKEQLYRLADKFAETGAEWVVLTGGEPLIVPGIDSVMQRLASNGIKIALSTNATLFKEHQRTIEDCVSSLNIPIDGSTPEIHALSRDDETSYHTFFDVLMRYQRVPAKKPSLLRVGTVYSEANKNNLLAMARVLEPFAEVIDTWKIYEIIDYEFQPTEREPLLLTTDTFKQDIAQLKRRTRLAPLIYTSSADSRDKAYFMVNPRGQLIMPTDVEGVTKEVHISDVLNQPLAQVVDEWRKKVTENYGQNHAHYKKPLPVLNNAA